MGNTRMNGREKRKQDESPEGKPAAKRVKAEKSAKAQNKKGKSPAAQERIAERRYSKQDTMTELVRHVLHAPQSNRQLLQSMARTLAPKKYKELAEQKPVIVDTPPLSPVAM